MDTGTLTILALDMPESARLLEFSAELVGQAVSFCNDAARALAAEWHGEIHSFLSLEDPLQISFRSANAAVEAVSALKRRVQEQPWHPPRNLLRAAVVTGDILRKGDSLVGPSLLTLEAMRLQARPGQVLISEATRAVVRQSVSDGHGFLALGVHHLEDSQRAQMLFQLLHPDLPASFQPLPSLLTAASNLPTGTTSFVGRADQIREVKNCFFHSRVVTLAGFAGIGKSRLAAQVAFEMLEDHYDGASYCDLRGLESEAQVYRLMASNLNVHETPGKTLEQAVLERLRPSELLILFDNADQAPLHKVIGRIIDICPRIQILITSRKPLPFPNVRDYTVGPMAVPTDIKRSSLADLAGIESVSLFVGRASHTNRRFELTAGNAETVALLCRKLEGIPLAIELAAARLSSLDLDGIVEGLEDRFALLRNNRKRKGQLALLEAVHWSYDVLSASEKAVLTQLCVFSGTFSYESALALCSNNPQDRPKIAKLFKDLIGAGILREDGGYFSVMNTIREFGLGLLIESGQIQAAMDKHASWYAARADELAPLFDGTEQTKLLEEIDRTYLNFAAALAWSVGSSQDERSPLLILGLHIYWRLRLRFGEGLMASEQVLRESRSLQRVIRGRIHAVAGAMASGLGEYGRAEKHFREAKLIGNREKNLELQFSAACSSGTNLLFSGHPEQACVALSEALSLARQLDDIGKTADSLDNLGNSLLDAGRYEEADRVLHEALVINSEPLRHSAFASNHLHLGRSARLQAKFDDACEHLESALIRFGEASDNLGFAASLVELAFLRVASGSFHSAAVLLGAEYSLRKPQAIVAPPCRRAELERMISYLRGVLGPHFHCEFERGAHMKHEEIREFLLLPNRAETHHY